MDAGDHQLLVWQTLQHIRLVYTWPSKIVFYQFSAKVRCYLFITSSNPHASASSDVLASHLSESPRPRVPTSLSPRVPASPRPRVFTSPSPHVPTSLSPRVPASPRPRVFTSPSPHVPTSPRPLVLESPIPQVPSSTSRPTFSNSRTKSTFTAFSSRGLSWPWSLYSYK